MTLFFNLSSANFNGLSQLCKPAGFAAGDKNLAFRDLVQHEILPPGIQLRQHIVQQQHRLLSQSAGHQLPLRQLQADGGGAGLTLRAVGLQGNTVERHVKIILVRAGEALQGAQLPPLMALQVILQLPPENFRRGKGIRHRGNRPVSQRKFLHAPGKLAMVSMKQLMDIADSGNIMPPKTTWFEPKLRSGLVIHKLE